MDQSVTRTQYDAGTIRKFKRMCGVAALLMVLLLRGDRTGGVERSAEPRAVRIGHAGWVCAALLLRLEAEAQRQLPQPTPFWHNRRQESVAGTPYRVKKCLRRSI